MATAGRIEGDLYVNGAIIPTSLTLPANAVVNASVDANAAIARTKLAQDALKKYPIDPGSLFVWDAPATKLPGTSSSDDLGFYAATFGCAAPLVRTFDVKNTTTTCRARILIPLPAEYDAGETIQVRVSAGMVTTVASSSATPPPYAVALRWSTRAPPCTSGPKFPRRSARWDRSSSRRSC